MRTEDLIDSLAADTRRVAPHAAERRIVAGLLLGGGATLALVVMMLGLRADLPGAMMTEPFLAKWAYTLSLSIIAVLAVLDAARPETTRLRRLWLVAAPVLLLAIAATTELVNAPASHWPAMIRGISWQECSMRVGLLALPIFGGLIWAFRRLAPTRLASAGAAAGLAAGGFGATLYGLHCPEVSMVFVLTWYSLGIATSAAIGALIGPRLLRW